MKIHLPIAAALRPAATRFSPYRRRRFAHHPAPMKSFHFPLLHPSTSRVAVLGLCLLAGLAPAAHAQVTAYTSAAAFNAATSGDTAYTVPNNPASQTQNAANPYTLGPLSIASSGNVTVEGNGPGVGNYGASNYLETNTGRSATLATTITLSGGKTAFSLTLGASNGYGNTQTTGGDTFQFSVNGGTLYSFAINNPPASSFIGFTSSTAITSVSITDTNPTTFGRDILGAEVGTATPAAPEPSTWALLGLGMVGASVVTLRRRARTAASPALAAALLAGTVLAPRAHAALTTTDQSFTAAGTTFNTTLSTTGTGYGQSFTPTLGTLNAATFVLASGVPGGNNAVRGNAPIVNVSSSYTDTFRLDLFNGAGYAGSPLASSMALTLNSTALASVEFTFASPVLLVAGSVYTFRVTFVGSVPNGGYYNISGGSGYAGGTLFNETGTAQTTLDLSFAEGIDAAAAPEPGTWALVVLGGAGLLGLTLRPRRVV